MHTHNGFLSSIQSGTFANVDNQLRRNCSKFNASDRFYQRSFTMLSKFSDISCCQSGFLRLAVHLSAYVAIWKQSSFAISILLYFTFYSSITTIFSIALDRFVMITYPFHHRCFMSGKKMIAWIGFIWLLSAIHPIKKSFLENKHDRTVKSAIGSVLIIFTGVLYTKAYVAMRKRGKCIAQLEATCPFRASGNISNKNVSIKNETYIGKDRCGSIDYNKNHSYSLNVRTQSRKDRAKSHSERAKNPIVHAQNVDERAQNLGERVGNACQTERPQSLGGRDQRPNERVQSRHGCVRIRNECRPSCLHPAQMQNQRVSNPNKHVPSLDNHIQYQGKRDENKSGRAHRNSSAANNAKEQRFLNTIIIIAIIAVVTVMSGTIYGQLVQQNVLDKNLDIYIGPIFRTTFCLNFAINPFIYCLRLKRYRKTFKIVYGFNCC